jgi:L-asparagine oxygenase
MFKPKNISSNHTQTYIKYHMDIVKQLDLKGYIFLKRYSPNLSTLAVTNNLKNSDSLIAQSNIVQLIPKDSSQSTPNTYSGQYGYGLFPMHTDLAHWHQPPRYILLRCLTGDTKVSTKILDGKVVISAVGHELLGRSLVKPRRLLNGKASLLRIFNSGKPSMLRWDQSYIIPASPAGEKGVFEFSKFLKKAVPIEIVLEDEYDTLIIDNWRMLHGRSSVPLQSHRKIERVYLGFENDPYNTR